VATKTRLPHKIGWALQDILDACWSEEQQWIELMSLARECPETVHRLALLRHHLAEVQRLASDALNGEYRCRNMRS
jgi:hypothetical protein